MSVAPHTTRARAGEMSVAYSRPFDAPVELLIRAHTDPAVFCRWMGPRGTTCELTRFDARTGGAFHYSVVGERGARFTFFGSYHEVTATRIVHTWEFEGEPGRPTLEILDFVSLDDGRCRLDGVSIYTSATHCTEMLAFDETGEGMDENFSRIDDLLPELT